VSAENITDLYEFNRYGNTWTQFLTNLDLAQQSGHQVRFQSVLSNLTVFGLIEFAEYFQDIPITYLMCSDPDYLGSNVLDENSKQYLTEQIKNSQLGDKQNILNTLNQEVTVEQRLNFSLYIKEFAQRRNLDLSIFPKHFVAWINE
jgi:hypothetical protein